MQTIKKINAEMEDKFQAPGTEEINLNKILRKNMTPSELEIFFSEWEGEGTLLYTRIYKGRKFVIEMEDSE